MDTPERIWVREYENGDMVNMGSWGKVNSNDSRIEYVRADFHEVAINRQKSAAKLLLDSHREIIRNLQNKDRSEYNATATLQSERDANAILTEENAAQAARIAGLEAALRISRRTIIEGGGGGVFCTVWVPHDISPSETLVDYIDAALSTPHSTMKETE